MTYWCEEGSERKSWRDGNEIRGSNQYWVSWIEEYAKVYMKSNQECYTYFFNEALLFIFN